MRRGEVASRKMQDAGGSPGTCAGSVRTSRPTRYHNKRKYHRVDHEDATPDRNVHTAKTRLEAGKHEQNDAQATAQNEEREETVDQRLKCYASFVD